MANNHEKGLCSLIHGSIQFVCQFSLMTQAGVDFVAENILIV